MTALLTRITNLIALASSPNEHEARNAALQACKLIRENKIALSEREDPEKVVSDLWSRSVNAHRKSRARPAPESDPLWGAPSRPRSRIRHTYPRSATYLCVDDCRAYVIDATPSQLHVECKHYGHAWIERDAIHASSGVRKPGDRGTLVFTFAAANKIGWNHVQP